MLAAKYVGYFLFPMVIGVRHCFQGHTMESSSWIGVMSYHSCASATGCARLTSLEVKDFLRLLFYHSLFPFSDTKESLHFVITNVLCLGAVCSLPNVKNELKGAEPRPYLKICKPEWKKTTPRMIAKARWRPNFRDLDARKNCGSGKILFFTYLIARVINFKINITQVLFHSNWNLQALIEKN